jgi:hypothetical protein
LTLMLLLGGCASRRQWDQLPVRAWPPRAGAAARSISIAVTAESTLNGEPIGITGRELESWTAQTLRAYENSGLFSTVKAAPAATDLQARVRIFDHQEANWVMNTVTGLTAFLVPSRITDEFVVRTTLADSTGKELGSFETRERTELWQQLFLVFATPFAWPPAVEREVVYDLNRAVLVQACRAGAL